MSKQMWCSSCGGVGKELLIGKETCYECIGTGRGVNFEFTSGACRVCDGKGRQTSCRVSNTPCRVCCGTKVIKY